MKKAAASRTARGTCSGCLELGGGSLPGEFHESAKAIGVVDRDVGEHLAVHVDLGLLEAVDQLRVAHALLSGGGVDPGDPQPPEVPLAIAPVTVRIGIRAHDLLLREPVARVLAAEVALGAPEDLLLAPLAGDGIGGAGHQRPPFTSSFLTRLPSASEITDGRPNRRFRPGDFFSRIWLE